VKSAKARCYAMTNRHDMTSLIKETLLRASVCMALVRRQLPVNGNIGKLFSEGPRDATVEELFVEAFYTDLCREDRVSLSVRRSRSSSFY
jgi:hypothetical protein